jgi:hypothetical protein
LATKYILLDPENSRLYIFADAREGEYESCFQITSESKVWVSEDGVYSFSFSASGKNVRRSNLSSSTTEEFQCRDKKEMMAWLGVIKEAIASSQRRASSVYSKNSVYSNGDPVLNYYDAEKTDTGGGGKNMFAQSKQTVKKVAKEKKKKTEKLDFFAENF